MNQFKDIHMHHYISTVLTKWTHWLLEDVTVILIMRYASLTFVVSVLEHFIWNHSSMNATAPRYLQVHSDPGNGLVLSGNKPLPEPILIKFHAINSGQWVIMP